jgi:hypothetical protein
MELRAEINQRLRANFNDAHLMELEAVQVYIKKAKDVVKAMDELDILKTDEDGNFVNRGQFMTLMMIFKEQQLMVGKLAQTDAAREYALYCRKAQLKVKEAKEGGMLSGEEAEVSFMDEETTFYSEPERNIKNITPPKEGA